MIPMETTMTEGALDPPLGSGDIVANESETMTTAPTSSLNNHIHNNNNRSSKDDHDGKDIMPNTAGSSLDEGVAPSSNDHHHADNDGVNDNDDSTNNCANKIMTNGRSSISNNNTNFDSSTTTIAAAAINANANSHTNETIVDTPTRRNNTRMIKKRREDGFFYAQDDKKEEGMDKKIMKELDGQNLDKLKNKKAKISSSSFTTTNTADDDDDDDESKQPHHHYQHDECTPPQMPNKQQQRKQKSQKCPTNDTILIQIPLSVTADLGVAMKRTRKKRMKRIKRWLRTATMQENGGSGDGDDGNQEKEGDSGDTTTTTAGDKSLSENTNEFDNSNGIIANINKNYKTEEADDDDDVGDDYSHETINKKQYSSIVDYLEAKYVRGVMIDDFDEKVTRKMKKSKVNTTAGKNNNGERGKDDEEEDSEKEGSIYSSDDGFIDDSLLNEEIVEQVMASSTYGMTQIEKEARRRKQRDEKVERQGGSGALNAKNNEDLSNADEEEGSKSNDEVGSVAASAADSDFDDGFFVNLGDLEMAEGWSGDVVNTPTKNKNKKRAYNKKTASTSSNSNKSDGKIAKKKVIKAKVGPPGGMKKKLLKDANKNMLKRVKSDSDKEKIKKKKKKIENGVIAPKKKNADTERGGIGGGKVGNEKTPSISNKKTEISSSPKMKAIEMMDTTASIVTTTKPSISKSAIPPKEKMKKPMSKEKEKATQLRLIYKRRYNSCLKLIREMTNEDLPRKSKTKNTMKVSVNIPADKEIGDELTFGNPNVPGQKLKVQIPKNADMEKRRFVVSIPTPKVTEPVEIRDNNFSKAFREALFNYSNAFDDWCNAEGEHNESLPVKERKPFKPGAEKLKKFDDMANEFPKNLATPIDASFLRKIAKQERSNRSRRDKRRSGGTGSTTSTGGAFVKIESQVQESEVHVPQKGTDFPSIGFDIRDFS